MNETSGVFHLCEGMNRMTDPPPYYYLHDDALDTATGERFRMVMLAIAGQFSYVAIQVDYCAWCGVQLTAHTRARTAAILSEGEAYKLYRKRHVKAGVQTMPLGIEEWRTATREYDETLMLVKYAKPEHTPTLVACAKALWKQLGLDTDVTEGDSHVDNHGDREPQPDGG